MFDYLMIALLAAAFAAALGPVAEHLAMKVGSLF